MSERDTRGGRSLGADVLALLTRRAEELVVKRPMTDEEKADLLLLFLYAAEKSQPAGRR